MLSDIDHIELDTNLKHKSVMPILITAKTQRRIHHYFTNKVAIESQIKVKEQKDIICYNISYFNIFFKKQQLFNDWMVHQISNNTYIL